MGEGLLVAGGAEHYREAERFLALGVERSGPAALALFQAAQVHATLALAAAAVLPSARAEPDGDGD